MFDVWYYESKSKHAPKVYEWKEHDLFIVSDQSELGVIDKIVMISYAGEEHVFIPKDMSKAWEMRQIEVQTSKAWKVWPRMLPRVFWQRVVISIFSREQE